MTKRVKSAIVPRMDITNIDAAEAVTRIYERIGNPNRTFEDIHVRDWCDLQDCLQGTTVIQHLMKEGFVASEGWNMDDPDRGYIFHYKLTAQGVAVALRQLTPAP